jgi:peptide/nickel transport system permease protein
VPVFLLRRVLSGLLLVSVLTFLTFFVFNTIPTKPACLVVACGPHTTTDDAMIKAANHQLGIDRPVFVQYGDWVWHIVRDGDFGSSWTQRQPVGAMIGRGLPITASLIGGGVVLMMLLALPLAAIAAMRPRTASDRTVLALSVVGLAVHPFVLAIFVRDWFGTHLHYFDFSYCPLFGQSNTGCGGPLSWAGHLAVPWFVFALFFLPIYMRMIRVRLLETYSEPYISTARAKGASEPRVLAGHALRNAIGPVLPMLAIDAGTAITAAIYLETVFGLRDGLGALAVQALSGAAGGYDLPLIAGIVAVVGTFVVLLNVGADLAGAWLDPRIRAKAASGLVPLPRAVDSRPRVRLALNVAVAAALVALLGVAIAHPGKSASGAVTLGEPVKTIRVNWDDVTRLEAQIVPPGGKIPQLEHGYLETRVTAIEIGTTGWRIHVSIKNVGRVPVRVLPHTATPGFTVGYPNQPFSLIAQIDRGSGTKRLEPFAATEFRPAAPTVLKPNTTWRGTFAGNEKVPKGTLLYAGFGQFAYTSPFDNRIFSTSTAKSATAP